MQNKIVQRTQFSSQFNKIRENLYFILLEPEVYGNIGATARALNTCGFKKLVLINPKVDKEQPQAHWMAHQSEEILNNAQNFDTFSEAISDKRLVIATTQRKRHFKFPLYSPVEIAQKIYDVAVKHPVAIIFGRERTGLTNQELLQCHIHSTIMTATHIPALNLAQAVMIYAHTFFMEQNVVNKPYSYDLASQEELEKFYEHLQRSLKKVGFKPRDSMDDFICRFKRLIGRSLAEKRDVRLLHKLLQIYEKRIEILRSQLNNDTLIDKNIY
jgi:TrmH family RNA methyltransferase